MAVRRRLGVIPNILPAVRACLNGRAVRRNLYQVMALCRRWLPTETQPSDHKGTVPGLWTRPLLSNEHTCKHDSCCIIVTTPNYIL